MMSPTEYPLTWPANMPRTKTPIKSQFRTALSGALANVQTSLKAFAADSGKKIEGLVISSNVTLGVNRPADPGVAVWFVWDGLSVCIPVDRYPEVKDNLQAIYHVIDARRTELRHGGLHIVRATFTGFAALPAPSGKRYWREVLDMTLHETRDLSAEAVNSRFRALAKAIQSDIQKGLKTESDLQALNVARDEALKEIGP